MSVIINKRTKAAIDDWMAVKDGRESRWYELFGTPERAARTLVNLNCDGSGCDGCSLGDIECDYGYDALLEWLRGDA